MKQNTLVKNFGIIFNGIPKGIYKTLADGNYNYVRAEDCLLYNCPKSDIEMFARWAKHCSYVWVVVDSETFRSELWQCESENKKFELKKSESYPIDELPLVFPITEHIDNKGTLTDEQLSLLENSIDEKRTGYSRYMARSKFNYSYYGKWNNVKNL